jgi:hypothetical protein
LFRVDTTQIKFSAGPDGKITLGLSDAIMAKLNHEVTCDEFKALLTRCNYCRTWDYTIGLNCGPGGNVGGGNLSLTTAVDGNSHVANGLMRLRLSTGPATSQVITFNANAPAVVSIPGTTYNRVTYWSDIAVDVVDIANNPADYRVTRIAQVSDDGGVTWSSPVEVVMTCNGVLNGGINDGVGGDSGGPTSDSP